MRCPYLRSSLSPSWLHSASASILAPFSSGGWTPWASSEYIPFSSVCGRPPSVTVQVLQPECHCLLWPYGWAVSRSDRRACDATIFAHARWSGNATHFFPSENLKYILGSQRLNMFVRHKVHINLLQILHKEAGSSMRNEERYDRLERERERERERKKRKREGERRERVGREGKEEREKKAGR